MITPLPSYGRRNTRWVREMRHGQVEARSPHACRVWGEDERRTLDWPVP